MGIQTREVNGTMYIDDELKEYLDSKFDKFEEVLEMKCEYTNNYKKDAGIKKILPVSKGIISSDVLEKYIKRLFTYSRYR